MNVFVTGTDTGVGKTFVTCLILKALRQRGIDAVGYKPVSCGDRDDGRALAKASGDLPLDVVNPSHLKNGVAPYVAGLLESQTPDPQAWVAGYRRLAENHQTVVVEGVGGWEVPLAPSYRVSDLAVDLGLPVLLVAANRLGALNHTLLTANAIRSRGLCCLGLVLNQLSDEMDTAMITNKSVIEDLTGLPLLEHLILDQDFSSDSLIDTLVRASP
jgi:dethiobiotin synthetase